MLYTLLLMVVAFWIYSFASTFMRARSMILERERRQTWVQALVKEGK